MDVKGLKGITVSDSYDADSLRSVVAKAQSGNTVLFIGAGFSIGCTNKGDTLIPLARDLSKRICKLGGFEEDDDLAYSADYYLKYNDPNQLIGLLKDYFTITGVCKHHESIAEIDWRRVYTTNYDNCYEFAAGKAGKTFLPITLEASPSKYFRNRDICVHINGAIQLLDNSSLESTFKLSESSYTNSDAFSDSSWLYRFRKDLDTCSQIIFVGYSLYDMEIKRLLVRNEDIKEKTCFIVTEGISVKERHRLSAFGEVFPIGAEEFGLLLAGHAREDLPKGLDYLSSLYKEEILYDNEFSDRDIRDFLLRGKLDINSIASSLTARDKLYAVKRIQVGDIISGFNSTNAFLIHGGIANGKTVTANQIVAELLLQGELVFSINDEEANYEEDIDSLADLNRRVFLVIDDFEENIDIVRYFSTCLGDMGKLILTERPHKYRRSVDALNEFGLKPFLIDVDYLHEAEIDGIAQIFDNTGLWGDRAGDSREKQIRYLTRDCESQLSIILLQLLKSPHIAKRFEHSFQGILKHPNTKKAVHSLCLIQFIYPKQCTKSFVSDIADSNHVYSQEFDERVSESGLFEFRRNTLLTRSSVFSTYILSTFYKASYTIDQLVRIAEKLHRNKAQWSSEEREIFRSIMTFGTLSTVLPERQKANSYAEFYEKLKREVPSVIGNPHYWLQYAMSVMSENNLPDAERILSFAYGKAAQYPGYDTKYIDNQYARLKLRQAIVESDKKQCIEYFLVAHRSLSRQENDTHKFRQAALYISFYKEKYLELSKGSRVKFEHATKEMLSSFKEFAEEEYSLGGTPPYQRERLDEFSRVIEEIRSRERK